MSVITYAALAYAVTAVISFGIVAVIVLISKGSSSSEEESEND